MILELAEGDTPSTLLDSFEAWWCEGKQIPSIVDYCNACTQIDSLRGTRVAWELAMVDLEFRWRKTTDPTLRRSTHWYVKNLAEYGFEELDRRELSLHEWIVRSRWGDQPTLDEFVAEQWPEKTAHEREDYRRELREQLELLFPIECNVGNETQHLLRVYLQTPCLVGRQRSTDRPAPSCQYDEAQGLWRLVVSGRSQNSVSREQLQLERVAMNLVRAVPLSDVVSSYVGDNCLANGKATDLKISPRGTELRFGNVCLYLRRV